MLFGWIGKDSTFTAVRLLIALAVLSVGAAGANDSRPAKKPPAKADQGSVWMKKKLEYCKNILDGLTKADFEVIKKNAGLLQTIKYLEAADRTSKEYKRQLSYFEAATKSLISQAGKKDINGTTLAYTQLTLSCVQCHNVVRDAKKK